MSVVPHDHVAKVLESLFLSLFVIGVVVSGPIVHDPRAGGNDAERRWRCLLAFDAFDR
jgi:hypothetical protein